MVPTLNLLADAVVAAGVGAASDPSVFDIVFPLTVLVLIGLAIPAGMLLANHVISRMVHGTGNTSPGKIEPYESGLNATLGGARERFSVKFYLIAMLFLAFDLEVAFLYPWAAHFMDTPKGDWTMVWLLLPFLVMLEVGYLYLFRKGALDWDD
ncbi:MAG: NADH-quinone oxidoreductase subunit A [Planctomycetes bacterium]|nr:NADH-quinone oxidoreductase subunit A [Planctomycetota bacterium]